MVVIIFSVAATMVFSILVVMMAVAIPDHIVIGITAEAEVEIAAITTMDVAVDLADYLEAVEVQA